MKQVLVIGGGSIGERHLRCFQRTGRCEAALCEINDDLRKQLCDRYAVRRSFADLQQAIDSGFDAAVICTPAHLHVTMATMLARKGLHVLIEKPLSTTDVGLEELSALTTERGIAVSVAYVLRNHPALQAVKAAIDARRFGNPVQVVYCGGQHFPFYRPAYRQIYYNNHATGGGAIQDALTHMMNAAEWLVGPVTRLVADAEHCVLEGVDVEDTVHVMTRHGNLPGSFSLNQHQPVNESTLTVLCEHGAVRFESHNSSWQTCHQPDQPWTTEESFPMERDDLFVRQAHAFLDQLEGTQEAVCTLTEATQTLRVNLAALRSVQSQSWVTL